MEYAILDEWITSISVLVSGAIAIHTMVSCHRDWPFLLIAIWKFCLSLNVALNALHRCRQLRRDKKEGTMYDNEPQAEDGNGPIVWLCVNFMGMFIGLVGLGTILRRAWWDPDASVKNGLRVLSIVFGCAAILMAFAQGSGLMRRTLLAMGLEEREPVKLKPEVVRDVIAIGFCWLCILASFYSDWVLGVVSRDLSGRPDGPVAAWYWVYFVAKRGFLFLP